MRPVAGPYEILPSRRVEAVAQCGPGTDTVVAAWRSLHASSGQYKDTINRPAPGDAEREARSRTRDDPSEFPAAVNRTPSIEQILAPLLVALAEQAHQVTAGVQTERTRLAA